MGLFASKARVLPRTASCSFCRKSHDEVGPLVEGVGEAYICRHCASAAVEMVEREQRRRASDLATDSRSTQS